jgi:hypothetical protein
MQCIGIRAQQVGAVQGAIDEGKRAGVTMTHRTAHTASHGERGAAATGGLGIRVADHELRAAQRFAVVDDRAGQVLQAERIDQQGDAVSDDGEVVLVLAFVEFESVLESGTTTWRTLAAAAVVNSSGGGGAWSAWPMVGRSMRVVSMPSAWGARCSDSTGASP